MAIPAPASPEPFDPDRWQIRAACRGVDAEVMFPTRGASVAPARAICARCDVREQCLDYALEHGIKFGVWGGTTERQRRQTRRALRQRGRSLDGPVV